MHRPFTFLVRVAAGWCVVAHAWAQAPLVYATLEPKTIVLGETAQLTITNLGSGMESVPLPVVTGLRFDIIGTHRQMEMSKGIALTSTATVVQVTPLLPGTYTIPPITPRTPSLVLQVNADHGPVTAKNPGSSIYQIRPPALQNNPVDSGFRLTQDGAAFVKMDLPKRPIYVGESVPVDIQVGVRSGFVTSVNGLPTLNASEFTLNNLSRHPERTEIVVDGNPFVMLTWHSILAPVKPGTFTLVVSTPLTIKVSLRARPEAALENRLGDPFMQNLFGPSVAREVNVASPATEVAVLALPADGRPSDFGGAVGTFKLSAELNPTQGAPGDPLTLRLHVNGVGNFDRVSSGVLPSGDPWKTYPPKSSFAPGDTVGYKGEKTFEQPVVATRAGLHSIAAISFSYFDPQIRRYETARSVPIAVSIAGAETTAVPGAAKGLVARLRADHPEGGATSRSLLPAFFQPQIIAATGLLTLALAATALLLRRRGVVPEPANASEVMSQLKSAAQRQEGMLFLETACAALRRHFAREWQMDFAQLSGNQIATRLGAQGMEIRRLFNLTDEQRYGGASGAPIDYIRWAKLVRNVLVTRSA